MTDEQILAELRKIAKIILLANAKVIESELAKTVRTGERKRMWVLTDGHRMPKQIAQDAGVSTMAVSYFLATGSAAGLIEYVKGNPPRRLLDYVPSDWAELVAQSISPSPEEAVAQPSLPGDLP